MKERDKFDILRVLHKIQHSDSVTTQQLAETFNFNVRTVHSYIQELCRLGLPIKTIRRGRYSGYVWNGDIIDKENHIDIGGIL